jgi:hypothetical protein
VAHGSSSTSLLLRFLDAVGCDDFTRPRALGRNRPILDDDLDPISLGWSPAIVILAMAIFHVASDQARLLDCYPVFIQLVSDLIMLLQNVVGAC